MSPEYLVFEDNGGGLHLTLLRTTFGGGCTHFFSGFEHTPGSLQGAIKAYVGGEDVSSWDNQSDDPEGMYDSYNGSEYGVELIVSPSNIYFDKMGTAGKLEFGIMHDTKLYKILKESILNCDLNMDDYEHYEAHYLDTYETTFKHNFDNGEKPNIYYQYAAIRACVDIISNGIAANKTELNPDQYITLSEDLKVLEELIDLCKDVSQLWMYTNEYHQLDTELYQILTYLN
jgi:hypothetical protein